MRKEKMIGKKSEWKEDGKRKGVDRREWKKEKSR